MSTFWTNTIWYVLLGMSTVAEIVLVLKKVKKKRKTFAFFLTILGITIYLETTILIYFKAYSYSPMILSSGPNGYDDVILGNLFSQYSISASLVLVAVFDLKLYWYLIIAALYGGIEQLFITLGIYSENWYRIWMTVAALPPLMFMTKWLYKKINSGVKPFAYYIYIILGLFPLNIPAIMWFFALVHLQDMSYTLLPDPVISRHSIINLYFLLMAVPYMFVYFSKVKIRWKSLILAAVLALIYIGYRAGLIWYQEGWFLPVTLVIMVWVYFSVVLLDRMYGRPFAGINSV